jgi:pyruvate dehydrogenase E2 component (dihydrolipoamide acetyltransferase)
MIAEGRRVRGGAAGEIRSSDLGPAAVKVSKLRELIAGRMRESLESTAQYTLTSSACATGLLALRARVKAGQERNGWPDININEMVMFCAVQALVRVPEVNVEYSDGHLYAGSGVHIGFACDTPKGLLVPVVKDAQKMTLAGFAGAVKELTKQATGGSISPDDLAGGTFTVSNLGMYGIESFTPILNAPQVAVLGVNAISLRPVRRDGAVEFVDYIGLSLTCDHQVIDGAPGARFLQAVREQIESIEAVAGLEG